MRYCNVISIYSNNDYMILGVYLQAFVSSRGTMIYTIVLLGLTFVHLIYIPKMTLAVADFVSDNNSSGFYSMEKQNLLMSPPLLVRLINSIVMTLMGIVSRINALVYTRIHLPKAFSELNSIDELLGVELKHRRSNIRAIWILIGSSILVGLIGQIYSAIFIHVAGSYFITLHILMNNLNNFTSVLAEAQFIAICYLIKSRFEIVNSRLLDIATFCDVRKLEYFSSPDPTELGIIFRKAGSHLNSKYGPMLRKEFLLQGKQRPLLHISDKSIARGIEILRLGHQRLCTVVDEVNYMFQLQLLFSLSGCFLNQLFNMYSFFAGGSWGWRKNHDLNQPHDEALAFLSHPLNNLSWAIYYVARFVAVVVMASKTTTTGKNAIIHILNIRRGNMEFATKEELVLFYDHVTSRKVEFSAAGFFNLDIALISSIVAAGSTYLVIMVQFQT
ncbi:putative gustatory receptor 28a isoform X2 [Athalia rosae]|uniref:putative gustatory receptor 28a isoform X2 n=1 Tax=Athalia rosae TaxID=37344 RepID=UPI002033E821|nr:putative gustatory receptor 28a isoform X2 [Athalia rosae]